MNLAPQRSSCVSSAGCCPDPDHKKSIGAGGEFRSGRYQKISPGFKLNLGYIGNQAGSLRLPLVYECLLYLFGGNPLHPENHW